MIHIYHGQGKGKTTAAVGLAIRSVGAGKRVLFCQFMKGKSSSELAVLRKLPQVQVISVGKSFGFYKSMTQQDKEEITLCHNQILVQILQEQERLEKQKSAEQSSSPENPEPVIVLDELASAYRYGLLDQSMVARILEWTKGTQAELVITGRNPDPVFLSIADYITEMKMERHPYEKGILARKGIEW